MGEATEQEVQELYLKYENHLLNYLMSLTDDDEDLAQDLIQETFVRFVACRRRVKKIEHPWAFLCRIATLLVRNHWRKQRRREELSFVLPPMPDTEKPLSDEMFSAYQVLSAIWDRLRSEEKLVAKAIIVDEMNQVEISRFTGMSRATVQRRIKRINKLAKKYREAGVPLD